MNKNIPHPKLKPYFPADTQIFGKMPYYKFLKNRPKHLQKLTIERYDNVNDNLKTRRAMGIHIKRLTTSTKSIQNLDFTEFPHKEIPYNVGKSMMKRFTKIKKISLIGSSSEKKLVLLNYLYLKNLKNLRGLVLDGTAETTFPSLYAPSKFKRIHSIFFGFLQKIKLKNLEYKLEDKNAPFEKILSSHRSPSSLEEWSLSCSDDFVEKLQNIDNVKNQLLNLKHLHNLKKFQILAPLPLHLLNQALDTIPQPDILKSLSFKIVGNDDTIGDVLSGTRVLLSKYQGLEHLAISSETWNDLFSLSGWRLKGLNIEIQTVHKENLKNLKEFIGQQQASLENLNLRLRFEQEPDMFLEEMCDFIEVIGSLKKLKSLRIGFMAKTKGRNDGWFFSQLKAGEKETNPLPILPLLINAINQLQGLKKLNFYYTGISFEKDFESFFQALQKKRHILESLEINLAEYKIQKRDLEILVKTLPQLKSLDTLKIRNLVVSDPGFFKNFGETVPRCSRLKCLIYSKVKVDRRDYNPQEMLNMFKNIFYKQNLTHIEYQEDIRDFQAYDSVEKLRLNDVYEDFPHIQTLILPYQTYLFDFPNHWKGI